MVDKNFSTGAMVMAGIPGPVLDQGTRELVEGWGINSFIIFSRNATEGPGRLKALVSELRSLCLEKGLGPPVVAVDQEGGPVSRLGPPLWPPYPSSRQILSSDDPEAAVKGHAQAAAMTLREVGINMNLAPVLDLSGEDGPVVLRERGFGGDPDSVSVSGALYITTLEAEGVAAVAKHFPGIGLVDRDPHHELPVVKVEKEVLSSHLLPFAAAVRAGVAGFMTSHVVYTHLDPGVPVTFSKEIVEGMARNEMGFDGMILTDDMEMGAMRGYGDVAQGAVRAVVAGHDMVLVCHRQDLARRTVEVLSDLVPKERVVLSVERRGRMLRRLEAP